MNTTSTDVMGTGKAASSGSEQVIHQWADAFFSLYPFETTGFLRTQKDRFANPVGHATVSALTVLYGAIAGNDIDQNEVKNALTSLVRVRAVQDLRPDQAVGALLLIKPLLRKTFLTNALATGGLDAHLAMEDRVDSLCLMAFNLYIENREVVFAQRVDEFRRERSQLERWASRKGFQEPST